MTRPNFVDYKPATENNLTGGNINEQGYDDESPVMREVLFNKKPYEKDIKKFQVSPDLVMAALVIESNHILIFNVLD